MSHPSGDVSADVKSAIEDAIADATAEVTGGGGHYSIVVRSAAFDGKSPVQKQRLVLSAIKHLMSGEAAPVHAVDSLKTLSPQ